QQHDVVQLHPGRDIGSATADTDGRPLGGEEFAELAPMSVVAALGRLATRLWLVGTVSGGWSRHGRMIRRELGPKSIRRGGGRERSETYGNPSEHLGRRLPDGRCTEKNEELLPARGYTRCSTPRKENFAVQPVSSPWGQGSRPRSGVL